MAKPRKTRAERMRAPAESPAPSRANARHDSWSNTLTGIGTARDRRLSSLVSTTCLVEREEAESLWRGDDMGAIAVERVPEEMTRKGFEIRITPEQEVAPAAESGDPAEAKNALADADPEAKPGKLKAPLDKAQAFASKRADAFPPGGGKPGKAPPPMLDPAPVKPPGEIEPQDADVKEQVEGIESKLEELDLDNVLREALCFERAFGGGAILLGVDDGATDLGKPLNEERIKSFTHLTTYAAYELWPCKWYSDPRKPKFGEPEVWEVCPSGVPFAGVPMFKVHESRLVIFKGNTTTRRARVNNRGWGDSMFTRIKAALRDYQMAFAASATLVDDFAQAVYKVKGLAELVASNRKDAILDRMSIMDQCRSVLHAVMLDADGEDFERKPTPIAGLADLLGKLETRLAAVFQMPVTWLFGTSPGGLNATGASDERGAYDRIAGMQEKKLKAPISRIIKLIMLTPDGPTDGAEPEKWSIEFRPLWELTELEQAELRERQAAVDKTYIDSGVLLADEVAASRFGGDGYSTDTVIDFNARAKAAVDHAEALAKHEEEKTKAKESIDKERAAASQFGAEE